MMKKKILTGDRPTGPLHIGHFVGSLENRIKLQDEYDCYFIIADYQALTDHLRETERTEHLIKNIILDWLSVGINPEKSTFFIQSRIPEIAELTMLFSMMVSLTRLQRNPTVKEEFRRSGLKSISYGFLGYPVSQAADILIIRPDLVPVGDDQLPHVEQTREIARAFNELFGNVFPIPKPLLGTVSRLSGLDGNKMGKSTNNAVFLSDTAEMVTKKIKSAVTDPARIRINDKGHPEICNVYRYHVVFNNSEATEIEKMCREGRLGCVACKEKAADTINGFLEPIRINRAFYEAKPAIIKEALQDGTKKVRMISKETINLVRDAMHFDYKDLLEEEKIAA
ncbi:MAG: tryptophan--tRNA ligase [Dehalococcoidales bacterium]|nr:MAG: tryptophan--tRNA ligase [Dehalococcoidales bacterium]